MMANGVITGFDSCNNPSFPLTKYILHDILKSAIQLTEVEETTWSMALAMPTVWAKRPGLPAIFYPHRTNIIF